MKTNYSAVLPLLNAADYLSLNLPPIEFLVGDFFPRGGSMLLGGAPKVGKSWFTYSLADAVARGASFLGWACAPGKVVVIDCDNRPQTIQHRLALLANSSDGQGAHDLRIITRETFTDRNIPFPDFRDVPQLLGVFELIGEADIVILDNVNLAFPGGNENDTAFWNAIETFVLEGRKRKTAVIVVHHTKKGDQYDFSGSLKQCRIFETGIALGKIGNEAGKGAHFNVVFKFSRELSDQADKFSAKMTNERSTISWEIGDYVEPVDTFADYNPNREKVINLREQGFSITEIANLTDLPRSTVGRLVQGIPLGSKTEANELLEENSCQQRALLGE